MIDEDRTMQLFGYNSTDLKPMSGKKIVTVCDGCGKYRVVKKHNYHILCGSCSQTGRKRSDQCKANISASKTGENHPNYGKNHSKDTIQKMCDVKTGEKNPMYGRIGALHPNWKGGITPSRMLMYQSAIYQAWRRAVFKRDDFTCQLCGERGGRLEAHHIAPVRDNINTLLMYDIHNGVTLCKDCHAPLFNRESDFMDYFNTIIDNGGIT